MWNLVPLPVLGLVAPSPLVTLPRLSSHRPSLHVLCFAGFPCSHWVQLMGSSITVQRMGRRERGVVPSISGSCWHMPQGQSPSSLVLQPPASRWATLFLGDPLFSSSCPTSSLTLNKISQFYFS